MINWLLSHPGWLAIGLLVSAVTMHIIEPSLHAFAEECDRQFDERGISPAPFILGASAAGVALVVCMWWVGVL